MTAKTKSRRKKRQGSAASNNSKITLWLIGAAAVALVIIAIWVNIRQTANVATVAEAQEAYEGVPTEWINGRILGNPEAPVTIQVWEDFL